MTEEFNFSISAETMGPILDSAISEALKALFVKRTSGYSGKGYEAVEQAVLSYLLKTDMTPVIENVVRKVVASAVEQAVLAGVKNRAGKAIAEMVASGAFDAKIAALIEAETAAVLRKRNVSGLEVPALTRE